MLSVCHESRGIAQQFYTKAFGTANIPAQTWIDFEKDVLYLAFDVCYWNNIYFYTDLREDIKKVKRLAIGGIWSPESRNLEMGGVSHAIIHVLREFGNLLDLFLVNGQHGPDSTADLDFDDYAHYLSEERRDMIGEDNYEYWTQFSSSENWDHILGWPSVPYMNFGTIVNCSRVGDYKLKKRKSLWLHKKAGFWKRRVFLKLHRAYCRMH